MQLRFDTRFMDALTLNMNYSLSKTIDKRFGNLCDVRRRPGTRVLAREPVDYGNGTRSFGLPQKHNSRPNFLYDVPF